MRNKLKTVSCFLVIISGLCGYGHNAYGQGAIKLSAGFGIPEFLHVGLGLQFDQAQIGLSAGTLPNYDESMNSFSGDFRYYFGGFSQLSDRPPWYGKIGLNYLRDETETFIDKYLYLNTRLGREFNISSHFGVEFEAGAIFELSYKRTSKPSPNNWWTFDFNMSAQVLPGAEIGIFYRF